MATTPSATCDRQSTRRALFEAQMTLLHLLSYAGVVAAACFVVLSLASGLLWISELIEEHSRISKAVGIRAIYVIIAVQTLLYLFDSLPLPQTIFSVICHVVYLQNFSHTWPFITLTSISFIASCVLSIINHFLWFFYFSKVSREARYRSHKTYRGAVDDNPAPGFADIATFFALCVWLIPLFLFLSLSANDNALPTTSDGHPIPPPPYAPTQPVVISRSSLFKSVVDLIPLLRRRRDPSEGIIVTHTPSPSAPSTPFASDFSLNQYAPSPQLSPRPSLDAVYPRNSEELTSRTRVSLRPPPKRNSTGPGFPSTSRRPSDDVSVVNSSLHILKAADDSPFRRRTTTE